MASEYTVSASQSQAPTTSYLTNDTLGSPRVTTDASGNVVSRRDFRPYGEEIYRPNQGTDKVRQKFTSYERDNETDLDFAQARMYQSKLGRFSTADSFGGVRINPQTLNRYSYVINMPLKYNDPTGLVWETPSKNGGNSKVNEWLERNEHKFLRMTEWVKDATCNCPAWVKPEDYAANPGNYELWKEMEYDTPEGKVKLDPLGPRNGVPQGWYLDGVAVGSNTESTPVQPQSPGQSEVTNDALLNKSYSFNFVTMISGYSDVRNLRSRAQALFPDSAGLDEQRHRWATRQTALRFGVGNARTFGILNEIQGFILHDLPPVAEDVARCGSIRVCISTRQRWAFEWRDLQNNELGIGDAKSIINGRKQEIWNSRPK